MLRLLKSLIPKAFLDVKTSNFRQPETIEVLPGVYLNSARVDLERRLFGRWLLEKPVEVIAVKFSSEHAGIRRDSGKPVVQDEWTDTKTKLPLTCFGIDALEAEFHQAMLTEARKTAPKATVTHLRVVK